MERLTKKINGKYAVENLNEENGKFYGEAIERLAIFENMVEKIQQEQTEYTKQIDNLKDPSSSKVHWRVKELMGKKLTNKGILLALKYQGIEVEDEA
ncbi:hypothetical protein [Anaerorhabdus furcosa]|uniref:Uncharacterized protein n=1 Tax=Anaerorhabdus furcosa TaxID=118967 RepID=A0A1T4KNL1_9FIRM|nr:hypothetical protein [Anaerorhabdus furcosa]SJZ43991.1 hypothetical protein SAMN02745191_0627 [Anaerorhabdus furcosa]